jgi:hypothetical protein
MFLPSFPCLGMSNSKASNTTLILSNLYLTNVSELTDTETWDVIGFDARFGSNGKTRYPRLLYRNSTYVIRYPASWTEHRSILSRYASSSKPILRKHGSAGATRNPCANPARRTTCSPASTNVSKPSVNPRPDPIVYKCRRKHAWKACSYLGTLVDTFGMPIP